MSKVIGYNGNKLITFLYADNKNIKSSSKIEKMPFKIVKKHETLRYKSYKRFVKSVCKNAD